MRRTRLPVRPPTSVAIARRSRCPESLPAASCSSPSAWASLVDVTVPGHAAGLNAVVVTVALLGAACLVAGRDGLRRFDPADAWLPAGAIWCWRRWRWSAPTRGWCRPTCCSRPRWPPGTIAALAGARITRGLVPRVLDAAGAVVAAALTGGDRGGQAAASRGRCVEPAAPDDGQARSVTASGRGSPCYRGLLIATPILLVFALLFASADAVFAGLVRDALDLPISIDLEDLTGRAVVVLVVAWAAAGLFALGAGRLPLLIPGSSAPPVPPARSLGAASAADLARGGAERWAPPRRPPSSSPSTRCSPRSSSSSSPTCSVGATRSRSPG